jgi:N-acyl-D-amino-acid deacylase
MKHQLSCVTAILMILLTTCGPRLDYDVIIRHGTIYDGSGGAPYVTDVAIRADTIAAIGEEHQPLISRGLHHRHVAQNT